MNVVKIIFFILLCSKILSIDYTNKIEIKLRSTYNVELVVEYHISSATYENRYRI